MLKICGNCGFRQEIPAHRQIDLFNVEHRIKEKTTCAVSGIEVKKKQPGCHLWKK